MAKDKQNDQKTGNKEPNFAIVAQFLKDLSFECPKPGIGIAEGDIEMEVGVELLSKKVTDEIVEVAINLKANAKAKEQTLFIGEVNYAGHFLMQNIPDEQVDILMGIEAPQILFPFARTILMNSINDAGFRCPMITPINFAHLYMQARSQKPEAPEEQKKIEDTH